MNLNKAKGEYGTIEKPIKKSMPSVIAQGSHIMGVTPSNANAMTRNIQNVLDQLDIQGEDDIIDETINGQVCIFIFNKNRDTKMRSKRMASRRSFMMVEPISRSCTCLTIEPTERMEKVTIKII